MKTINITLSVILFLIIGLSIWFWGKIKALKEQITTTKTSSLTASNTPTTDFESRLKKIEDCFEE
jgi:hypothetical protein